MHSRQKQKLFLNSQKEQLEKFRNFLIRCLETTGIQTNASYFDIMIQPKGTYDGLLYFSKIPIDSSDKILRKKIALDNHEYRPETRDEKMYLQSIFEVRENGHPRWYALQVSQILLERNICDNTWIAVSRKNFPYCQLREDWHKITYRKGINETPDSFGIVAVRNYADTEILLHTAIADDLLNNQTEKILSHYCKKGLHDRDADSNHKTFFLFDLYKSQPMAEEVYHAFEIIKIFLKRITGTKAYLHYKGNNLIWTFHGAERYIHVCRQNRYNIGGLFYNEEQLKEQMHNIIYGKSDIPQKEWYSSLVPFLAEYNITKKGRNV